ncbi:hypothetical protein CKA32_000107 [Geitlerinema sp. FC II]|nr:hypothetical protein CKA32_000107 [Geitlerinema sp. FC II]
MVEYSRERIGNLSDRTFERWDLLNPSLKLSATCDRAERHFVFGIDCLSKLLHCDRCDGYEGSSSSFN